MVCRKTSASVLWNLLYELVDLDIMMIQSPCQGGRVGTFKLYLKHLFGTILDSIKTMLGGKSFLHQFFKFKSDVWLTHLSGRKHMLCRDGIFLSLSLSSLPLFDLVVHGLSWPSLSRWDLI